MKFKNKLKKELQKNNQNNIKLEELVNKMNIDCNKKTTLNYKTILRYGLSISFVLIIVVSSILITNFMTKTHFEDKSNSEIEYLKELIENLNNKNEGEDLESDDILKEEIEELKQNYNTLENSYNNIQITLSEVKKENDSLILQNEFLMKEFCKEDFESGDTANPGFDNVKPVYQFSTGFTYDNLIEVSNKVNSIPFIYNKIDLKDGDYILIYSSKVVSQDKEYMMFYHKLVTKNNSTYNVEYIYKDTSVLLQVIESKILIDENTNYLQVLKNEFTDILTINIYDGDVLINSKEYTNNDF